MGASLSSPWLRFVREMEGKGSTLVHLLVVVLCLVAFGFSIAAERRRSVVWANPPFLNFAFTVWSICAFMNVGFSELESFCIFVIWCCSWIVLEWRFVLKCLLILLLLLLLCLLHFDSCFQWRDMIHYLIYKLVVIWIYKLVHKYHHVCITVRTI